MYECVRNISNIQNKNINVLVFGVHHIQWVYYTQNPHSAPHGRTSSAINLLRIYTRSASQLFKCMHKNHKRLANTHLCTYSTRTFLYGSDSSKYTLMYLQYMYISLWKWLANRHLCTYSTRTFLYGSDSSKYILMYLQYTYISLWKWL
jgi:hypothetical protein